MQTTTYAETPLLGLIRELREDIKTLFKQEVQLAKAEVTEKTTRFGRNAAWLAVGGVIAYAGVIVLLLGLGFLLAFAFEAAGLSQSLAICLGLALIGLIVAGTGAAFVFKAIKTFSREPLAPEKTLHSLSELKPHDLPAEGKATYRAPEPKRSSDEVESMVGGTRHRIGEAVTELSERMKPQYVRQVAEAKVQQHPVVAGLVAAGAGLAGFLFVWKKVHQARERNGAAARDQAYRDFGKSVASLTKEKLPANLVQAPSA